MDNREHPNGEVEPPLKDDGVRVETLNGRQELIVPGRFELSWSPADVDGLEDEQAAEFRQAMAGIMAQAHGELSTDPAVRAEAAANRHDRLLDLAAVMRVTGTSIAYPGRNTRYTSMDGMHFMPEEIVPGRGMDEQGRQSSIPNPFNIPELQ